MSGYIGASPLPGNAMSIDVYDPGGVGGNVYDRANHIGTQTMSTISDAGQLATVNWPASDGDVKAIQNGSFISIKDNLVDGDSL